MLVLLQLDYMTAQQKSDMLNAKSDKRDIMREKEQLKLDLEHLKKWMQVCLLL